jgi:hypothetical protein
MGRAINVAKKHKSPREKKELEYAKGHFTFGFVSSRNFPKTWKRKKTLANREYRHKSEELLTQAKAGIKSNDEELMTDDLTPARFQKSISRKRLRKTGTVTVGEKVRRKLEARNAAVGRNVRRHEQFDNAVSATVKTLGSLERDELVVVVRRAELLTKRNADELKRVVQSKEPIDRALYVLYRISIGSAFEIDALRRNPEIYDQLRSWMGKAQRILEKDERVRASALQQKRDTQQKLKALNKRSVDRL